MLDTLKELKLWQKLVLVVVFAGIIGGIYGIYAAGSGSSNNETIADDITLVPIQYGDLENSVSVSGSVVFSISEKMTFGSAGTVEEVNVEEGDTVAAGHVLAKLDDTSMIALKKAVVQARIDLQDEEDIAQAEADVTNARIALQTAEEELEDAITPYDSFDVAQAELDVINAKISLSAAEDAYKISKERYDSNPTIPEWKLDYEQKREQLAAAESTLVEAEEKLEDVKAGADPLKVEQKQKALTIARYNLEKAEAELAGLQGNATSLEAELRQLEVAEAQAALDDAIERLEDATMVAPFDGIVASVKVEAGDEVSANTVVIEFVDPTAVEVSAILDEIDISEVQLGQRATVSLDALVDIEFDGEVNLISAVAQSQSGVVSYPISIELIPPSGVQLREGMSATATIIVEEAINVMLVPNQSIGGTTDNPVVSVLVDGEIQQKAVSLGITNGTWTEVKDGLQDTDVVAMQLTTTTTGTTSTQFGGMRGGFAGGGMPGGGFIIR